MFECLSWKWVIMGEYTRTHLRWSITWHSDDDGDGLQHSLRRLPRLVFNRNTIQSK